MLSKAEYLGLDGLGMAALVNSGEVTPRELMQTAVSLIETLNPKINAVVTTTYQEAETAVARGGAAGPFQGVPFLLKDLGELMAGVRLTGGSKVLADFVPEIDSELTIRFRQAGCTILGKTNTPEFGLLPTTESELLGRCRNPWQLDHSTGGSSGGAAAAVAAGLVPLAHASDGGGSIRIPASCCGIFGIKPTRARTPQGPVRGDSMNGLTIGNTVSRSVRDSAAMLDAIAGPELGAPYWAPPQKRPYLKEITTAPGALRIAYMPNALTGAPVHPDVTAALDETAQLCESLGHHIEMVDQIPGIDVDQFVQAFTVVWVSGCAWSIKGIEFITGKSARPEMYEPLTWQMYQLSQAINPGEYLLAVQGLQQISRHVAQFFLQYDVLLTPVVASPAPLLGHFDSPPNNPMHGFQQATLYSPFTPLANVTGQPAMSVPLHWNEEGLPIGSHFMARFGDEATLFRLAAQLESARPWLNQRPSLVNELLS